jgi:hypothetical protein
MKGNKPMQLLQDPSEINGDNLKDVKQADILGGGGFKH